MAKKKKYKPVSNPKLAAGMAAIAFSGAWGIHNLKHNRRARTRQAAKSKAIKDFE